MFASFCSEAPLTHTYLLTAVSENFQMFFFSLYRPSQSTVPRLPIIQVPTSFHSWSLKRPEKWGRLREEKHSGGWECLWKGQYGSWSGVILSNVFLFSQWCRVEPGRAIQSVVSAAALALSTARSLPLVCSHSIKNQLLLYRYLLYSTACIVCVTGVLVKIQQFFQTTALAHLKVQPPSVNLDICDLGPRTFPKQSRGQKTESKEFWPCSESVYLIV